MPTDDAEHGVERTPPRVDFLPRPQERGRLLIALFAGWVCALVLIGKVGQPGFAIAGILLAVLIPGWLTAETVLPRASAEPEQWVILSVAVSIVITIALGAVVAATGNLTRTTLGWCWLGATSVIGVTAIVVRRPPSLEADTEPMAGSLDAEAQPPPPHGEVSGEQGGDLGRLDDPQPLDPPETGTV